MTDWKDYRVSPLHCMQAVSLSRPNFSNQTVPSVAHVWQLASWATSPARQQCLLSPVHWGKGYWRQEAHAIVWQFMYLITRPSKFLVDGCCDYITAAAWRRH